MCVAYGDLVKRGRQVFAEHVDAALCCYRLWVVARTCLFPPTFATKVRGGVGCRLNVSRSDNLSGSPRYTFSLQPPLIGAWPKPMQCWVRVLSPSLEVLLDSVALVLKRGDEVWQSVCAAFVCLVTPAWWEGPLCVVPSTDKWEQTVLDLIAGMCTPLLNFTNIVQINYRRCKYYSTIFLIIDDL